MSAHGITVEIISRDPNVWQARCACKSKWTGPTYEAVEDFWREHVYASTGSITKAFGDRSVPRWSA